MEAGEVRQAKSGWTRSPIWMLLFGLLVFSLVAGTLIGRPLVRLISSTKTTAVKEYRDDSLGFALRYPAGWQKLSPEELAKFQGAFAFAVKRARPSALFSVKVQPIETKNVSLKTVAGVLDRAMPKNFPGFKKLGQRIIHVDNRRALKYDYVFTANGELGVRERLIIIPADDKVFHLTAWSAAKNFARVADDFNQISAGFKAK